MMIETIIVQHVFLLRKIVLFLIFLVTIFILIPSAKAKPQEGYNLHIDAKMHFPGNPEAIAHHYCKEVSDGLTECQLYDSDNDNAKLVGAEMVVSPERYNSFSDDEKEYWHYHKTEIPRVSASLPDLSREESAKIVKSLEETYGKVYLLWDPTEESMPMGDPFVHVLDDDDANDDEECD